MASATAAASTGTSGSATFGLLLLVSFGGHLIISVKDDGPFILNQTESFDSDWQSLSASLIVNPCPLNTKHLSSPDSNRQGRLLDSICKEQEGSEG